MKNDLPLGTRLVILGVSGPLVSTLLFLGGASIAAMAIARQASLQLSNLFQEDNRESLLRTTRLIQASASQTSQRLILDSEAIRRHLRGLAIDGEGRFTFQGKAFTTAQAASLLNDLLRLPLSMEDEAAGVFFETSQGQWHRLTGITKAGTPMQAGWLAPAATLRELESLTMNQGGEITPRNTLLQDGQQWRVTRLTPLNNAPPGRRLVASVGVSTDAATGLLTAGANLFPQEDHEVAFFGWTPSGQLYCSYQRPRPTTCRDLQASLAVTGGIPRPGSGLDPTLEERREPARMSSQGPRPRRALFVATFPDWNWVAAFAVNENVLRRTLVPVRQETVRVIAGLIGLSVLLVLGCGFTAWRLAHRITRQLQQLAEAADAIASGQTRQPLTYGASDAIGRLVQAFNRMAGAVAEREEGLRAQIQELTISINRQSLQGQVCSILEAPHFQALSERAQAMRARRRQLRAEPGPAPSPPEQEPRD